VRLESARELAENMMREHVVRPSQGVIVPVVVVPVPPGTVGRGEQTRGTRAIQRCPDPHSRGFGGQRRSPNGVRTRVSTLRG
jgi:hypothetical protein